MEMQTQRQRVYQTILNAAWQAGPGVEVFNENGFHTRFFMKVQDGDQYFIFYTRLRPGRMGFEVVDGGEPSYTVARELREPNSVGDNARFHPSARDFVLDRNANYNLLILALNRAQNERVTRVSTRELAELLRGASVLPLK
jgi:hypothetical protein